LNRICLDSNPKIIRRIYDWDGKTVKIDLCESHRLDPDFAHYVKEEELQ